MANKTVKTRVQIKRGTASEWARASEAETPFIPLDGEFIYYTDTGVLKIGDGTNNAEALPVYADGFTNTTLIDQLEGYSFAGGVDNGGAARQAERIVTVTRNSQNAVTNVQNANVGATQTPVYISDGKPVACSILPYAAASTPGGPADEARRLVDASGNPLEVGTTANPVYFHDGVPVETNIPWAKGATTGDRPALHANKIIKGNVASGVDHHVGGSIKPIYIDTNGVPQECTGISSEISYDGVAAKATQLEYSTTFNLTGAVNATGVSFNGKPKTDSGGLNPSNNTANINVTEVKEAYLTWGGKNVSGGVSPVDAAAAAEISANRFAFANPAGVSISYSRAGGAFTDSAVSEENKIKLISGSGSKQENADIFAGNRGTSGSVVNDKLRVEFNSAAMGVYTRLQKLLVNASVSDCTASVTISTVTFGGTETALGSYNISGYPSWNSFPIGGILFGAYDGANSPAQIEKLILTFTINSVSTASAFLGISNFIAIGDNSWTAPSTLSKTGHIYEYDANQNVTFPGTITTERGFNGLATKASGLYGTFPDPSDSTKTKTDFFTVGDADEPVYFQDGIPVKGKRIPNILTGTTAPTASLGQNGDIYLMPYANNLPAIYSGTSAPASTLGVDGDIYILYE